jgi:hypothetical protein
MLLALVEVAGQAATELELDLALPQVQVIPLLLVAGVVGHQTQ